MCRLSLSVVSHIPACVIPSSRGHVDVALCLTIGSELPFGPKQSFLLGSRTNVLFGCRCGPQIVTIGTPAATDRTAFDLNSDCQFGSRDKLSKNHSLDRLDKRYKVVTALSLVDGRKDDSCEFDIQPGVITT